MCVCVCVCVCVEFEDRNTHSQKGNVNCCRHGKISKCKWNISSNVYFPTEWLNSHRETWHLMFKHERGGGFWWRQVRNVNTVLHLVDTCNFRCTLARKKKCLEINLCGFFFFVFVHRTRPYDVVRVVENFRSLQGHFLYAFVFLMWWRLILSFQPRVAITL